MHGKNSRITQEQLKNALETLPEDQKHALTVAAERIRSFHEHELGQSWSITEKMVQSSVFATQP